MLVSRIKACLPIAMCSLCAAVQAAPVNGSFDGADFSGWQLDIPTGVSQSHPRYRPAGGAQVVASWGQQISLPPHRTASSGRYFAALNTADNACFIGHRTYHLTLNQSLWLDAGDVISGWASFYNGDIFAQDSAWVRILDAHGLEIASPWRETSGAMSGSDPNSTPYRTLTPWTRWEWQSPADGNYIVSLGMTTSGDDNAASFGFFEDLCVHAAANPVPEPTSLSLILLGAMALAARHKSKP